MKAKGKPKEKTKNIFKDKREPYYKYIKTPININNKLFTKDMLDSTK